MNNNQTDPNFFDQRTIIWTNINLMRDAFYRKLKGQCSVCQDAVILNIPKLNFRKLEHIRESMNIEMEQPLISIDILNDGIEEGIDDYSVIPDGNIRNCFEFNGRGVKEWYVDEKGDLRSFGADSEEQIVTIYRMFKPTLSPREVEDFKTAIVCGACHWDMIEKCTDPIGYMVMDYYPDEFEDGLDI